MKRKVQLITGGIIILLVAILSAYYLGFFGEKQVKLQVYSPEVNTEVTDCLEGILGTDKEKKKTEFRDKLIKFYYEKKKQNILHYAFNYGDPFLFCELMKDTSAIVELFKQEDSKGYTPLFYYERYCKLTGIEQLKPEELTENPLKSIEHLMGYMYINSPEMAEETNSADAENTLIAAIEEGKLEDVQKFLFSNNGNNDKQLWKKALQAVGDLRSTVPKKREIEKLLKTLKKDRDESKEDFWKEVNNFLDSAPNVASMVNYLHKLVVTDRKERSLLYYITQVKSLRAYQMYKCIHIRHEAGVKSAFSDLLLTANDPYKPIELVVDSKDEYKEYKERLNKEIEKLKGYIAIDPEVFEGINPAYRDSVNLTEFNNRRTFFHACVLNEAPEKLERSCAQYLNRNDKSNYSTNWNKVDIFGLKPADYFPLVKDAAKKQHLRFLQEGILAPTQEEIQFLNKYKAKELELGNLSFDGWINQAWGAVVTNQKDPKRNILHIAVWLGDLDAIQFLSDKYPDFKALCQGEDSYAKTPLAYAECRVNKAEKQQMCSYLTTTFGIKDEINKDDLGTAITKREWKQINKSKREEISPLTLAKAITECNWQQISKWQREETNAFGHIWAKYGSTLRAAIPTEKPTTIFGQGNYLKLLELLSKCDAPSTRMVHDHKALVDKLPITLKDDVIGGPIKTLADQYPKTPSAKMNLTTILSHSNTFIPDYKTENKTIVHELLPTLVVENAPGELDKALLKNTNISEAFKQALCMKDNNGHTPLDLVKKALEKKLQDKKSNAEEVSAKLKIIKKYEEEHLAAYKREYTYRTKDTAEALYKKGNYKGLVAYLKCPASYMSRSLLETMVKDGAYDVIAEVCNTGNPYVRSAANALVTPINGQTGSRLTTLLNDKSVKQAIKFRYCLLADYSKDGNKDLLNAIIMLVDTQGDHWKQIERMGRAHPVYCATIVNKLTPATVNKKDIKYKKVTVNENSESTTSEVPIHDFTRRYITKLYSMYYYTGVTAAKKEKYKFNNAHIAVICNQPAMLSLYRQGSDSQLKTWLKQEDRMGRTPLYYINYGIGKKEQDAQALFQFINKLTPLSPEEILKSPQAIRWLGDVIARNADSAKWGKEEAVFFLNMKAMLDELAQKAKTGRNSLHYACVGIDDDKKWFLKLLEEGEYTVKDIDQTDINGCTPLDYVPAAHRDKVDKIFAIFRALAELKQTAGGPGSMASLDFKALIQAVKAYKPDRKTLEMAYPYWSKAKKFWRKGWIGEWSKADTWGSLFGVRPNRQATYLGRLYSLLLKPAYKDIATALIAKKKNGGNITLGAYSISLNEQDIEGKTWLIKAIEKQQWDIAKLLVNAGVDLSKTDIYDTDVQFLTIGFLKTNDGDLKTQLLTYIGKQENMHWGSKTKQWFGRRWKQLCYAPQSSLDALTERGAKSRVG